MVVLNKKAFRLPRVDPQTWGLLLRLGLNYNRTNGTYSVVNCNNIDRLLQILSEILHEDVRFTQTCLICGKDFPCQDCTYQEMCATRDLPFHCVCPQCLKEGKSFQECL